MNEHFTPTWTDEKVGGIFDCLYDPNFTLLNAEESLFILLGYTREEFQVNFQNHLMAVIPHEERSPLLLEIERQLSNSHVFMYENRLCCKNGKKKWIWISGQLIRKENAGDSFHCIFHDITKDKLVQEELALSERRYEIILSQTQDIIFELDCSTFEVYYSANFEKKFGYRIPMDGFPNSMFNTDIIYEDDKAALRSRFQDILSGAESMECEYRLKMCTGAYIWVDIHATALRDKNGKLLKILGIISDINTRKQEILEARKDATTDPLTHLLNRRECIRQIESYMRLSMNPAAFFLIDIDNFKLINDTFGHLYGDSVLSHISSGMRQLFRKRDIISRIGGDEFVVFMADICAQDNILPKIKEIQKIFSRYNTLDSRLPIGCSIGVSFYPTDGDDFPSLFDKADMAMYQAKRGGKGHHCIYNRASAASASAAKRLSDPDKI